MSAPEERAPDPIAAGQAQGQDTEQTTIVAVVDADSKAFARAAALAAMAGCTLHELAGGGYLLGRWTMCRELPDLRAVHSMLTRMGVRV